MPRGADFINAKSIQKNEPAPYTGYIITDAAEEELHTALIRLDLCETEMSKQPNFLSRIARNLSVFGLGAVTGSLILP